MVPIKIHNVVFFLCISSFVQAAIEERVNWDSKLYDDHPLVGKIWSSELKIFLSPEQIESALLGAKYLILGEKHDNSYRNSL